MHVVIAPDKFKGTLTATEAAEAIAAGWRIERPQDTVRAFPISDGGDGFGDLLARHLNAEERTVDTVNAAHEPIRAPWWWAPRSRMAIIASARIIGLAMLPRGRFHPFQLDTFGLGAVLRAAAAAHPRVCLMGIGGSATNDAGFGLARAIGWRFRDRRGEPIEDWTRLPELERIERPERALRLRQVLVAVDVTNRLMGVRGATRVYGPQKGIRTEDVKPAERCLRRLVRVLTQQFHFVVPPHHVPGSGAAGGLGFGLRCFGPARLEPGFRLFARLSGLLDGIRKADLVITGEGAIDLTTVAMGKGVGQLMRICGRLRRPCIALAGQVHVSRFRRPGLVGLYGMAPTLTTPEEAMARPAHWLGELGRFSARAWSEQANR